MVLYRLYSMPLQFDKQRLTHPIENLLEMVLILNIAFTISPIYFYKVSEKRKSFPCTEFCFVLFIKVNFSELVIIIGVVTSYPAFLIFFVSNVTNLSPCLTLSPVVNDVSKNSPSNCTVLIPIWIRISTPSSEVSPIACLVGNIADTVPLTGASTSSPVG